VSQVPAAAEAESKSTIAPDMWALIPAATPIIVIASIVAFSAYAPMEEYRRLLLEAYRLIEEEGLGKLEPLGREYASARHARVTTKTDIERFYLRLIKFFKDVNNILDKAMSKWPSGKEVGLYQMVARLWSVFNHFHINLDYIVTIIVEYLLRATGPVFRKDPLIKVMPRDAVEAIIYRLVAMEEKQEELTNKECIWIFGKAQDVNSYTFAALMNDVTACTHTLLDYARAILDPELREVYNGVYAKNPNPVLLDCAISWRSTLIKLHELGIASDVDYPFTKATVIGDKAELVVGSAPGHAVHAEIRDNEIIAVYYDRDESVHRVLTSVAKNLGVDIIAHEAGEYTTFSVPVDRCHLLFKCILPFATSLDMRIVHSENQRMRWSALPIGDVSEIQRRHGYNTIEAEVHLILEAIKALKLDRP
jgi:hypothetical protein